MANLKSKRLIGYAGVSTKDQEVDALKKAGVLMIFEGPSELQKCLDELTTGDVLIIYKMGSVACSLEEMLLILDRISKAGAFIRSLTEPLDTSGPAGPFISQLLSEIAELK
jgi:DNA invertase Pin-like site-specific DNA recombinase